uniref:Putative pol protein n=1 Tax=Zea mays TaxID=4577 RepID=Q8S469_MAIZE|nr:putative pol protein [Zea mays]
MTPEEILRKFVSGCMMVKEARYVDDALNGPLSVYEPQLIALKATSSKEALPSKVAQVEAAGLNENEMALIIKRFKTALRGCKEYPSKSKTRGEALLLQMRCKYFDVDTCNEHLIAITKLNDEVASLNAQLKTCKSDFDKLKFARDAYTIGRHPSIKDGLGF